MSKTRTAPALISVSLLPCPILRKFFATVRMEYRGEEFSAQAEVTATGQNTFAIAPRNDGWTRARKLRKDHEGHDAMRALAAQAAAYEVYRDSDATDRLAVFAGVGS